MSSRLVGIRRLLEAASCLAAASCHEQTTDVVSVSHDVVVDSGSTGGSRSSDRYEYIARGPMGVVALAESRGIAPAVARQAVDHLASTLNACVIERSRRGVEHPGAARVVAQIAEDGTVAGESVRVDPGTGTAETAVLCLVGPTKMLTFSPIDAGTRGIAIEALWGQGAIPPPP